MATGWEQYEAIHIKFMNFQEDGPRELLRDGSVVVKVSRYAEEHAQCFEGWAPLILRFLSLFLAGPGSRVPLSLVFTQMLASAEPELCACGVKYTESKILPLNVVSSH